MSQVDFTDAAFDFQVDRCGSFAVGVVGVFIVVVFEAVRVDRADATGGMHHHTDFTGQADRGLADAALDIGVEIFRCDLR